MYSEVVMSPNIMRTDFDAIYLEFDLHGGRLVRKSA